MHVEIWTTSCAVKYLIFSSKVKVIAAEVFCQGGGKSGEMLKGERYECIGSSSNLLQKTGIGGFKLQNWLSKI